ncbi:MAG: hypothetical protein ABI421_09115 [Polyangiaceae bacterium]
MSDPVNPVTHRDEWNAPRPVNIPRSTAWPLGTASGIMLFAWGFVSSPIVLGVGVVLLAVSLYGWIGEIRHE